MVELRKRPAKAAPVEASRPSKKASTPSVKADAKKAATPAVNGKKKGASPAPVAAVENADVGKDADPKLPVPDESTKKAVETGEEKSKRPAPKAKSATPTAKTGASAADKGDAIDLSSFGGEVETHDGKKVTLKQLVDESESGVVLFTYPKASTPGCTTQACAFRDGHETLTSTGFAIYGLSGDSPKANTTFKTKQNLPYTLLCNPTYSLIGAIGLQQGSDKKTKRGVWAVDKQGKVLLSFAGGPIPTVDAVKKLVDEHK